MGWVIGGLGVGGRCVLLSVKLMTVLVLSSALLDLKAVAFRLRYLTIVPSLHVFGDLLHYTP